MDSYSGSEPRLFISFHLGNESNGQPPRRGADDEKMDSNDSFVTAIATTENQPAVNASIRDSGEGDSGSAVRVGAAETSHDNPETGATVENLPAENLSQNNSQQDSGGPSKISSQASNTPLFMTDTLRAESSSTDESCGEYIARKWQQLGCSSEAGTHGQSDCTSEKFSESVAMELAPKQGVGDLEDMDTDPFPTIAFLDSPDVLLKSKLRSRYGPPEAKTLKLSINETRGEFGSAQETGRPSISESEGKFTDDLQTSGYEHRGKQGTPARIASSTGQDSEGAVGSTVAQALCDPASTNVFRVFDSASNTSVDFPETAPQEPRLGASSRALIKEFFESASPVHLPAGHQTLALNEGQVCSILKAVADEAVKASLKTMESLIQRTSRLSLGGSHPTPDSVTKARRPGSRASSVGSRSGLLSGHGSDTSGVLRSDDNFSSLGYSYEHSDLESQPLTPPPKGPPGCSRADPGSQEGTNQLESPGAQTLAGLKAEAIAERTKPAKSKKARKTPARKVGTSKHQVPRGCKIMKESYFKGMEWTKTFVSGPVDPRWNPYKFYCQICKGNISIYGRGAREILRHHQSERHLRKDQRWTYEHLSVEDPVTGTVRHHVRGRDGKLLTPYQLEQELKHFIDEPLVDIGEKLPFYEDYIRGTDYMASSSDSRAKIQISVLGNYLRSFGDISTLRNFWRDVGVIVNHQSLFTDFDWSKERLSVSNLFWPH